jgi:hypothetical protein
VVGLVRSLGVNNVSTGVVFADLITLTFACFIFIFYDAIEQFLVYLCHPIGGALSFCADLG